ncbi:MAG: fibronectin type III domain-containing protein, partial [Bacteroidales bacterium]|nr:fibronectin type III domain-containing protein [Bacteroidales bacterium]
MRKNLLLLLVLTLFCLPWANAQNTLTVYETETGTNSYVPIYGLYVDDSGLKCEYIIPATELQDMIGMDITKMTFYLSSQATAAWNAEFQVFMKEVNQTTLTGFLGTTDATIVYSGVLNANSSTMDVNFSNYYNYQGGNLLVGFYITQTGSWKSASFYGKTTTENTAWQGYSSYSGIQFIPRTTFSYETPSSCPKPTNLASSNVTSTSATLSWTETGSATNWTLEYSTSSDFSNATSVNVSGTASKNLTGLTAETTYYARVKAVCAADDESEWSDIVVFMPTLVQTVSIGSGTSTFYYLPTHTNYNYSYTQQIYTATEIGQAGTIKSISFKGNKAYTRNVDIYMINSDKESFTSTTDYVNVTSADLVYTGSVTFIAGDWTTITLAGNGFDYTGGNLIIVVDDNTGSYLGGTSWSSFTTATNQGLYFYQDASNIDPTSPSANNYNVITSKSQIQLGILPTSTPKPRNLEVSDITAESATVTWTAPANATPTGYQYQYKYATTPTWPDTWNSLPANVTQKDLVALAAGTLYDFRVRANYTEGDSDPAEIQFTTLATCPAPEGLQVVDGTITAHTVQLSWTSDATAWQICLNGDEDNLIDVTENPYTLMGLEDNTKDTVKVRAVCGDETSEWSSSVTFTTPIACPAPTNLTISDVTAHGAKLNWEGTSDYSIVMIGEDIANTIASYDFENNAVSTDFTNGTTPWIITNADKHNGTYSIKSGNGGVNSSTSDMLLTVNLTESATLTFWAKISSESSWDKGYFSIDGTNKISAISGAGDWIEYSYELAAGEHTLRWYYTKDGSGDYYHDCFYVDDITIVNHSVSNWISYTTMSRPYTINDPAINPETTYQVKVESGCEGEEGHVSDILTFTTASACQDPDGFELVGVTATSLEIDWNDYGLDDFNFKYRTEGEEWTLLENVSPTMTINSLQPSTTYQVLIQAACNPEVWSDTLSYTTACAAQGIPYTYDFETEPPFDCWTPIAGAARNSNSTYAHESTTSLKFSGTTKNMIVLPQFTEATNTLRVEFWTRPESTSSSCGSFAVGYLTDLTDTSSFVALDTYTYSDWSSASYVKKKVDFNVEGVPVDAYIAMRQFDCSTSYYWFVDDVTVKIVPSCLEPSDLDTTNVTTNTAELSWTANSGEESWTIYYKKISETEYTNVAVTTNPYTLEGLVSSTAYEYYVVANCSATDVSEPSEVFHFNTACGVITVFPWSENFDNMTGANSSTAENVLPNCWNYYNGTTYSSYDGYPLIYNSSSYSNTGSNHLRFYSYYSSYSSYSYTDQYAILPEMQNINTLRIKLFSRLYSISYPSSLVVGVMSDPTDISTFDSVGIITPASTTYEQFTVNFDTYTGDGSYIALKMTPASSSSSYRGVYVDDITVEELPNCLEPTDLAVVVNSVTAHTVQLSWTANSGETAWTLYYTKITDGTYTEVPNVTNPYTLEGLDADTEYSYYVVANCSETDQSEPSEALGFVTACEAISDYPYTENFDNLTGTTSGSTNILPNCWSRINTTTYSNYFGYPTVYADGYFTYANSTPNCLRFFSAYSSSYSSYDPQPQYAILPEMENLAGKQITLSAKGYDTSSTFRIGTITDPTDASTFSMIAEQPLTDSYQEFTYNVPADATAHYIAIMIDAAYSSSSSYIYNGAYIDDITIDVPPACPKPTDLAVVANSVTAHTAQLQWTSDATAWQICLNNDETNLIDVTENPYTLSGLAEDTKDTVKVRAVCGSEFSEWSTIVTFTTLIACPAPTELEITDGSITATGATVSWAGESDSYDVMYRTAAYVAEGIYEDFDVSGIPSGWTRYSGLVDDVLDGTATLSSSSSWYANNSYALGTYNAKLNIYGTNCKHWLVTPEFNLTQNLSFDLALTDYGNGNPIENDTAQDDDRFVVLINANDTWTILREWNNTGSAYVYNNIATTGESVSIDLSAYQGLNVKIAFYGESTVSSNGDNDLHIDNIHCGVYQEAGEWQTATGVTDTFYTITGLNSETQYEVKVKSNCEGETGHETEVTTFTTVSACQTPDGLAVSGETTTSAIITWNAYGQTAFNLRYSTDGENWTTEENVNTPHTLAGLTAATNYQVQIQAACNTEVWSSTLTFTTLCEAISTFPWSEDFESFAASIVPDCWDNSSSTSTTLNSNPHYIWGTYSYSENKMLRMYNFIVDDGTAVINTPTFDLPAEGEYEFSFDYSHRANCGNFTVNISEDGGETFNTLNTYSNATDYDYSDPGDFTRATISLADYAGKSVILQFAANANFGDGAIFVDNMGIEMKTYTVYFYEGTGDCETVSINAATITLPTATISCDDWSFAGWATAPVNETTTAPTFVTSPYTPASDSSSLYAVYTDETNYNSFPACIYTQLDVTVGFESYTTATPDNGRTTVKPTGWTVVTQE